MTHTHICIQIAFNKEFNLNMFLFQNLFSTSFIKTIKK